MKIKMWVVALVIFLVICGGIGITMLTGDWATTTDKIPAKYETGESAGEYNPEDIRGSYTFNDVSGLFGVELTVLYDAFGIPQGTDGAAIKTKDIEASYGDAEIGNESVQVFVALYKGLPVTLVDTYLPKRAVEILLDVNPALTQEQKEYLVIHEIDAELMDAEEFTAAIEAAESAEAEAEQGIKGGTTFQQAMDFGITREQIETVLGGEMPAANMAIRDYCTQQGVSFSEIKAALNELLAQE